MGIKQPDPDRRQEAGQGQYQDGKYLTFSLDDQEYGIGILKIKEIIGMMTITTVPRTPECMKGVINLRGKVIPVVDLRLRFAMAAMGYNERTCIIVVEIRADGDTHRIGIVVDAVSEVLNVKGTDIEPAPSFGSRIDTDYVQGVAKTDDTVKLLLDIDRVLTRSQLDDLARAA